MSEYTDFIKRHSHDAKFSHMTPQQRMKKLAEMWRSQKGSAKPKETKTAKATKKARGKGFFGDIIGSVSHLIPI